MWLINSTSIQIYRVQISIFKSSSDHTMWNIEFSIVEHLKASYCGFISSDENTSSIGTLTRNTHVITTICVSGVVIIVQRPSLHKGCSAAPSRIMNTFSKPGLKSVHPSLAPVSYNILRGARCASRCTTAQRALGTRFADPNRPPPLLLPAPGVATFCTPAVTSSLGQLPRLAARPARLSASRAGLSAPAQESAAAGYSEQLEALVRKR